MSKLLGAGQLRKMRTNLDAIVDYHLPLGEQSVAMNSLIGSRLRLDYEGVINCLHCNRKTRKSFNQGYCYPCFTRLAQCDSCIVSPEKCHYHEGTCREPAWGDEHCMIEHLVYLANTSGIKVGITRHSQVPTRWMDQGAVQALPIFRVATRRQSGLVETCFKEHVSDRTNWQAMLKGEGDRLDLAAAGARLSELCAAPLAQLRERFGLQAIRAVSDAEAVSINYPVSRYPTKVVSHNLDKAGAVEGLLLGIKGQYLIFDSGVINMRKYGGYQLRLSLLRASPA